MRRRQSESILPDAVVQRLPVGVFTLVSIALVAAVTLVLGIVGTVFAVPLVWAGGQLLARKVPQLQPLSRDPATGLLRREGMVTCLDQALFRSASGTATTAAIILEINDFRRAEERFDHTGIERLYTIVGERLREVVRQADAVGRLDGPVFAVALSSVRRLDLEAAIQLCTRLQQAVSKPIPIGDNNLYVTASVGFCLASRLEKPNGARMLQAATTAMIEAERGGAGAVRGYSEGMRNRIVSRNSLSAQVSRALDNGELTAFFQPQVSTSDRRLTGFETLARWDHPERGLIPPMEFLPALAQAGLMEQLGQQMVQQALSALRHWDSKGFEVPQVAVNFDTEELRNPGLVNRIGEQIEHFGLTPGRLTIEVLETVVAGRAEDQVIRNLAGLSRLGCTLDLDDFGTGHASITNIRRFSIARIKIDRSFVTNIDQDPDQQMMFAAILTMADRLDLDTLAEGVETSSELAMLAELGCRHVQGFGIARPMPLAETDAWIAEHAAGVLRPLSRRTG